MTILVYPGLIVHIGSSLPVIFSLKVALECLVMCNADTLSLFSNLKESRIELHLLMKIYDLCMLYVFFKNEGSFNCGTWWCTYPKINTHGQWKWFFMVIGLKGFLGHCCKLISHIKSTYVIYCAFIAHQFLRVRWSFKIFWPLNFWVWGFTRLPLSIIGGQ